MSDEHAKLSPSSAHRWMTCRGAPVLEEGQRDSGTIYSAEGTAAHTLATWALTEQKPASAWLLQVIKVDKWEFVVDDDMAKHVQSYMDHVLSFGGTLFVENRVPIDHLTGEKDAAGTADAVVFTPDSELVVVDLKFGKGEEVDVEDNQQLVMYALAVLREFAFLGDPRQVRVIIHQPRLDMVSEHVYTIPELEAWAVKVREAAGACNQVAERYRKTGKFLEGDLNPGAKQCKWCRAKAICPALAGHVLNTVADDFVDLAYPVAPQLEHIASRTVDNPTLGRLRAAVPLIEDWCAAVSAKVETELLSGAAVPGWKLVQGRAGARKWGDAEKAAALLGDAAWEKKLISPTTAEKLLKKDPLWKEVNTLILIPPGRPVAVPDSDKRRAVDVTTLAVDDFDVLTEE